MGDFDPSDKFIRQLQRNRAEVMLTDSHLFSEADVREALGDAGLQAWLDVKAAKARYRELVRDKFP